VEVQGDKVILRGRVRSAVERQEAERIAWSAPGISQVENQIVVTQQRPKWLRVVGLVVVLLMLVLTVAVPGLLYRHWLNSQPPTSPPQQGASDGWPEDLRIEAAPGAEPK
jgi:hypothetical protein